MWRFLLAPVWLRAVCYVLLMSLVGAAMVALVCVRNPALWREYVLLQWPLVLAGVLAFGFVLGVVITGLTNQSLAKTLEPLRGLTPDQRHAAYTAAHRGPAPEDPVVRAAALHICEASRPPAGRAAWVFVGVLLVAALAQVPVFAVAVASEEWRQSLVPGIVLAATGIAAGVHSIKIRRYQRQYQVLTAAQREVWV